LCSSLSESPFASEVPYPTNQTDGYGNNPAKGYLVAQDLVRCDYTYPAG
jgi:hypothetical protein